MSFAFKRGDRSVHDAARRLAAGQLDAALKRVTADVPPDAAGVHALRKHCKKTRGMLRLFYPVLKGARRDNAALGGAARLVAPLRDAEVRLGSFDLLARELPPMPGLAVLRIWLQEDVRALRADDSMGTMLPAMVDRLQAVRARVDEWRFVGRYADSTGRKGGAGAGFDVLRPGLARTWRTARKGLVAARSELAGELDAEPFHEWRKQVKHHWYQARLLSPIWPEMMRPHVVAADALGNLLGDHNDLDVLCTHLAARVAAEGDAPECAAALAALERAAMRPRRLLAERAVALGERLLAPSPSVLVALWGSWWVAWRR